MSVFSRTLCKLGIHSGGMEDGKYHPCFHCNLVETPEAAPDFVEPLNFGFTAEMLAADFIDESDYSAKAFQKLGMDFHSAYKDFLQETAGTK